MSLGNAESPTTRRPESSNSLTKSNTSVADAVKIKHARHALLKLTGGSPHNPLKHAIALREQELAADLHWSVLKVKSIVQTARFEVIMGIIIFLNIFIMAIHPELRGYRSSYKLGIRSD